MIWPLNFSQGRPAQLTSTLIGASAGLGFRVLPDSGDKLWDEIITLRERVLLASTASSEDPEVDYSDIAALRRRLDARPYYLQ